MLSFIGATLGAVLAESFSSLRGGACEEPVAWFAAWLVGVVGSILPPLRSTSLDRLARV